MTDQRISKFILAVLTTAFGLALLGYFYLWVVYDARLPLSPDEVAGRVYADNFRGVVRYETSQERFRLHTLRDAGAALALMTISVGLLDDRRRGKYERGAGTPPT